VGQGPPYNCYLSRPFTSSIKQSGISSFIYGETLAHDPALDVWVSQRVCGKQVNFASKIILELVKQAKKPLRQVAFGLPEFHQEVNIARWRGRTFGDGPEYVEAKHVEFPAKRLGGFLDVRDVHAGSMHRMKNAFKF
jgi:hypothetical protein